MLSINFHKVSKISDKELKSKKKLKYSANKLLFYWTVVNGLTEFKTTIELNSITQLFSIFTIHFSERSSNVRPTHYKWIEYQEVGKHLTISFQSDSIEFSVSHKIKRRKVVSSNTENFTSPSPSSRHSKKKTGSAVEVEPIKSRTKMLNFDYFSNTRKRKNIWILEKANLNFDFFPSLLFATE